MPRIRACSSQSGVGAASSRFAAAAWVPTTSSWWWTECCLGSLRLPFLYIFFLNSTNQAIFLETIEIIVFSHDVLRTDRKLYVKFILLTQLTFGESALPLNVRTTIPHTTHRKNIPWGFLIKWKKENRLREVRTGVHRFKSNSKIVIGFVAVWSLICKINYLGT